MPTNGERIKVPGSSGKSYEYVWTATPAEGGMKIVFFAPDKSYVVAFFKTPQDANAIDRLENLVGVYRERIFNQIGGDYWQSIYCWPTDIVNDSTHGIGLVVPAYPKQFFFAHDGSIPLKGAEKIGSWFTTPDRRFGLLDQNETGDWLCYFNICRLLACGFKWLHRVGLAHSDLSYKNILIDPVTQSVCIVGIDDLIVPGFPSAVHGTPDFIAPEVYKTMGVLSEERVLPSILTNRHSLAVLIYQLLLCRHPLRGKKIWDYDDQQRDEMLSMGEKALFIEHPTDRSNRYDAQWVRDDYSKRKWQYIFPWMDLDKLPYTTLGPLLAKLIERAFIEGLHEPDKRPAASEWEDAILRTIDLMRPCANPNCRLKWFVSENNNDTLCPLCHYSSPDYSSPDLPVTQESKPAISLGVDACALPPPPPILPVV